MSCTSSGIAFADRISGCGVVLQQCLHGKADQQSQ
ncbi:MAG: hypothetical protein DID91_2727702293 [Candidatus Nitrotoga sp. MKT]|nr:MAG: hypothetical protein DID91_2727702293 [Candidatus Nitrotoga sp. MKT]